MPNTIPVDDRSRVWWELFPVILLSHSTTPKLQAILNLPDYNLEQFYSFLVSQEPLV